MPAPLPSSLPVLDPRLNAFRADLADCRLAGRVAATRFCAGTPMQVATQHGRIGLYQGPGVETGRGSELLHGEPVRHFDQADGWAWVQSERDGYVGYCRAAALGERPAHEPTHRVRVPAAFVHRAADLKSPRMGRLFMGSTLTVADDGSDGAWTAIAGGGYVHRNWLAGLHDGYGEDPAAVAELYRATPYLWGGKTAAGLDCSGLVQIAFAACAIPCPRDADMQEAELGRALDPQSTPLRRNDLVFWPGHVGIMLDATQVIHANATDMAVQVWSLAELRRHIRTVEGADMRSARRP